MSLLAIASFAVALAAPAASDQTLAVDEAVRVALAHNPRLAAAHHASQALQAQADRDKPVARPTLTVEALGALQGPRVGLGGANDPEVLPERLGRVTITLDQMLYHAGMGAARARFAAQSGLSRLEVQRARNDLVLEVRRAFYDCVMAAELRGVADAGLELARKHRTLVADMLEAGLSSARDLKAADADVAEAEQGAIAASNGRQLAWSNLRRLTGNGLSADRVPASDPALPPPDASTEMLARRALLRRPEVLMAHEGLAVARAGASLARTQTQPAISARATATRQTATALNASSHFSLGLALTWNLLDGGKARFDAREATARAAELTDLIAEAEAGVSLEIEKAWRDMSDARARIAAADRQVAAAQAALDISMLRYEQRSATQLEVSAAIFGVTRARGARAVADHDLRVAAADLRHAEGADSLDEADSLNGREKR